MDVWKETGECRRSYIAGFHQECMGSAYDMQAIRPKQRIYYRKVSLRYIKN